MRVSAMKLLSELGVEGGGEKRVETTGMARLSREDGHLSGAYLFRCE